MNKKIFVAIVLAVILSGGIAHVMYGQSSPLLPRPLGRNASRYIDNPRPIFPDNSNVPEATLITRQEILSSLHLPEKVHLTQLNLMTWTEFNEQDGDGGVSPQISGGRQVWVLQAALPEYNHYRFGVMRDAELTFVFDAQTGDLLTRKVTGIPDEVPAQAQ
jgi:hypothetical protein